MADIKVYTKMSPFLRPACVLRQACGSPVSTLRQPFQPLATLSSPCVTPVSTLAAPLAFLFLLFSGIRAASYTTSSRSCNVPSGTTGGASWRSVYMFRRWSAAAIQDPFNGHSGKTRKP